MSVALEIAKAVLSSATAPMSNQLAPALVEYCQTPSVTGFAVFATTAMPLMLEPESTSPNWPLKMVETASPVGFNV
ncbi:hypothetical protein, partial [Stieleria sp.]|uniref:hypothetical protein n=1 Tax=Stieleria sp. TaxID=2795976 RepID=UPI00356483B0